MEKFNCPHHGNEIGGKVECVDCKHEAENGTDPATMTVEERITELRRWMGPITTQFGTMWPRLDALVGRSTFNHEWAQPERIYDEMHGMVEWDGPMGSLKRVAPGKPIAVIELPKKGSVH